MRFCVQWRGMDILLSYGLQSHYKCIYYQLVQSLDYQNYIHINGRSNRCTNCQTRQYFVVSFGDSVGAEDFMDGRVEYFEMELFRILEFCEGEIPTQRVHFLKNLESGKQQERHPSSRTIPLFLPTHHPLFILY